MSFILGPCPFPHSLDKTQPREGGSEISPNNQDTAASVCPSGALQSVFSSLQKVTLSMFINATTSEKHQN